MTRLWIGKRVRLLGLTLGVSTRLRPVRVDWVIVTVAMVIVISFTVFVTVTMWNQGLVR